MRSATGITVFAGMLGVTPFGLVRAPVFYVALRRLVTRSRVSAIETVDAKPLARLIRRL